MRPAFLLTIALLTAAIVAPAGSALQTDNAAAPEPVNIYPCFQPGTFNVVILEKYQTGCIGLPPDTVAQVEARPDLIEVYPCFRPGTFYFVIAGTVTTGCLPPVA